MSFIIIILAQVCTQEEYSCSPNSQLYSPILCDVIAHERIVYGYVYVNFVNFIGGNTCHDNVAMINNNANDNNW